MAESKCPKCESTSFEAKKANIDKLVFQYIFIQCASCGTVLGVVDSIYVPEMVQKILAKVNILK